MPKNIIDGRVGDQAPAVYFLSFELKLLYKDAILLIVDLRCAPFTLIIRYEYTQTQCEKGATEIT